MLNPTLTWRPWSCWALTLGLCLAGVLGIAACGSEGPTAPSPPTSSTMGSTVSTTSVSNTSVSTTSVSTTSTRTTSTVRGSGCAIEPMGSIAPGSLRSRFGSLTANCVSSERGSNAAYYSFSVQAGPFEIHMISMEVDAYLLLRTGREFFRDHRGSRRRPGPGHKRLSRYLLGYRNLYA